MSILIAKKYVKALLEQKDLENLIQINDQLKSISTAFNNEKFNNIIDSIDVSIDSKVELIISFLQDANYRVVNLIKLLGANKRLNLIPILSSQLNYEISILTNNYTGIVHSNESLNDDYMNTLEDNFAKKFNVKLSLINEVSSYNGIKVDIEGLGVEISFAKDIFKSQLIEHILKAV